MVQEIIVLVHELECDEREKSPNGRILFNFIHFNDHLFYDYQWYHWLDFVKICIGKKTVKSNALYQYRNKLNVLKTIVIV